MASRKVDEMVWQALIDETYCHGMLNGRRQELAQVVNLSEMEREVVMSVRADTLEAFAAALS